MSASVTSFATREIVGAQREVVDVALDVLMPCQVADVLNNPDHGRHHFMLHAEAELSHCGRTIVLSQAGYARRENRNRTTLCGIRSCEPVLPGSTEGRIAEAYVVGKRRVGSGIVDVVTLHALEEGSEAAAENGLAVAEEIFREAYARLQRFVVVGHQSRRESILPARPMPLR